MFIYAHATDQFVQKIAKFATGLLNSSRIQAKFKWKQQKVILILAELSINCTVIVFECKKWEQQPNKKNLARAHHFLYSNTENYVWIQKPNMLWVIECGSALGNLGLNDDV